MPPEPGQPGSATRRFSLSVAGADHAPVLGALQDISLTEGQALSLAVLAADADGDPLTITLRHLPPGASTTAPAEPPKTAAAMVQTEAEAESESTRKHILSDAGLRELEAKAQAQWRAIVGLEGRAGR